MSRQFEHLQEATLKRLQAVIPHDCPLVVHRFVPVTGGRGAFDVQVLNGHEGYHGRAEVVAAWIDGYLTAWKARV